MKDHTGRTKGTMGPQDFWRPYHTVSTISGSTTTSYTRFENNGATPCAIVKRVTTKDADGNVTEEIVTWAWAVWSARATASFVPINESWNFSG